MVTKTITTTVTLIGPDANGVRGEREPGTPVTLQADVADRILARHGGVEVPVSGEPKPKKGRAAKLAD